MEDGRTIRVRCSTWEQVATFYTQKLKGSTLVIRLPFLPQIGEPLTLALGLPNDLAFAVEGVAAKVSRKPVEGKYPVAIQLDGLTAEMRARLEALIEDGRAQPADQTVLVPPPLAPSDIEERASAREDTKERKKTPAGDNGLPKVQLPSEDIVRKELEGIRKRLYQQAAHDVLGVTSTATLSQIRSAYFRLAKKYHPDVYGKHRSAPVRKNASEVFIHINKAYDRLRDAATAAEGITTPGPALRSTPGWVVEFDDVQAFDERKKPKKNAPVFDDPPEPVAPVVVHTPEGQARQALLRGNWSEAREFLVEALGDDPRNRPLRALFHVASGMQLKEHGRVTEARLHFETALAHDPNCVEATRAMELGPDISKDRDSVLRRIFQRP